jgi:hypothetical protein
MVNHTVSDAVLEWTQTMALTGSLHATLAAADAWSTTDFRPDLAARLIPGATFSEYEGEPHGLYRTASRMVHSLQSPHGAGTISGALLCGLCELWCASETGESCGMKGIDHVNYPFSM